MATTIPEPQEAPQLEEQPGLYELIGGEIVGDLTSQDVLAGIKPEMSEMDKERLVLWAKEFKFWEDFSRIYHYLEYTRFYNDLVGTVRDFAEPNRGEIWLDAGCGSVKMSQLIWEKSGKSLEKIIGIDIVLEPARQRLDELGHSLPLELKYANLGEKLPFADNFFDGIVANACLTSVIDFNGKRGKAAFTEVMREMFRILKPRGHIVWSTPKRRPFYWKNFLVGLPAMFSIRRQIQHRIFAPAIGIRILKYGLGIVSKGRKGIYPFLDPAEYEEILGGIGFGDFRWKKSFAGQVWVNRADKLCPSSPPKGSDQ